MPGVSGLARGVASAAPYTPRAREGPGRECSSREVVSGLQIVKSRIRKHPSSLGAFLMKLVLCFCFSQFSLSTSLYVVASSPQYKF